MMDRQLIGKRKSDICGMFLIMFPWVGQDGQTAPWFISEMFDRQAIS